MSHEEKGEVGPCGKLACRHNAVWKMLRVEEKKGLRRGCRKYSESFNENNETVGLRGDDGGNALCRSAKTI